VTVEKTHRSESEIAIEVREIGNGECTLTIDMYCTVHCAYGLCNTITSDCMSLTSKRSALSM